MNTNDTTATLMTFWRVWSCMGVSARVSFWWFHWRLWFCCDYWFHLPISITDIGYYWSVQRQPTVTQKYIDLQFVNIAFNALTLLVGHQEEHLACKKIKWWGVGVVICLERGADCLHMVQLMPLHPQTTSSFASFNSRLVSPFWYRLTQVVLQKEAIKRVL